MKNLLFVSSECVPFIKTGGLADVVGSLPKCFDKQYYDCRVFLPKYMCMDGKWKDQLEYVTHFYMDYDGQSRYVGVLTMEYDGVLFYFLDNEYYFSGDKPYLEQLIKEYEKHGISSDMAKQYIIYQWLYDNGLTEHDLTGIGFTNEYLS